MQPFINKSIKIRATPEKIWKALSEPSQMKQWMSDSDLEIITSWQIGSPIIIRVNVNDPHEYKGIVLEFEPVTKLKYTSWSKISKLKDAPENYSAIEFGLTASEDFTNVKIIHSNLIAAAAVEHSNFYWMTGLDVLRRMVELNLFC